MTARVIVSYDGTDGDRDALALGRLLARAGASLELAYVRHGAEGEERRERLAEARAEELLAGGAAELGDEGVPRHVLRSASTPEGLRALALDRGASLVVFGSEYRTAPGHVDPQASTRRLLDGGPVGLGLAPAGMHARGEPAVRTVGAVVEDGDPCVLETAAALAARLGAELAAPATGAPDLLVVGSKPGTVTGRVTVGAAVEYLIELVRCPLLVLPRGVSLRFD